MSLQSTANDLYDLLHGAISGYEGKICVPISGGLDSRILAAVISERQRIDLAFCFCRPEYARNVLYAKQIVNMLKVKEFIPLIHVDWQNSFTIWQDTFEILNQTVSLSEYTIIFPHYLDYLTGQAMTPFNVFSDWKKRDTEWLNKNIIHFRKFRYEIVAPYFKTVECPTENTGLIKYCIDDMPKLHRIQQRAYRYMAVKYYPELAKIPRERFDFSVTSNEFFYIYQKLRLNLRKITGRDYKFRR